MIQTITVTGTRLNDGRVAPRYDAAWPVVEAEWFMTATHADKVQSNGATNNTDATFAVRFHNATSTIGFPSVVNLPARGTLALQLAAPAPAAGGALAVYLQAADGARGQLLAECRLPGRAAEPAPRSGVQGRAATAAAPTVACPFQAPALQGELGLLFVFVPPPAAAGAVELDSWSITPLR